MLKLAHESNEFDLKQPSVDRNSTSSPRTVEKFTEKSANQKQLLLVKNESSQAATNSPNRQNKTGKRWNGSTMRSTRYLNESKLDDVKLIGIAATINISESASKEAIRALGTGSQSSKRV